ncbi:MAG: hypothetical protein WCG20_02360 [bacterium]
MMKNIIKKITSFGILIAVVAVAPLASANYSINSLSNDCKTVTIANHTTGVGAVDPCWPNTSVNAAIGEVINVAIYYNNSGTTNADNVSFKLSDPQNQTITNNGSLSMTGSILVNGQVVKSGVVTVNVSGGPSALTLGNVMRYDQAANANLPVSGGNAILSSGFNYGTLAPGWSNQGVIKVSFTVVSATNGGGGTNGIAPNVSTSQYSNFNANYGNVTLNGNFDSNGYTTTTSFKYRVNGGAWIDACVTNRGTGSGSYNCDLTNLSAGTYEYKAYATNAYGNDEGSIFTFVISGNNTTSCPSGYTWNGNYCVVNTTSCPSGYYLSGNTCIQNPVSCPSGYYVSGNTCVQNPVSCPSGYYLSGNTCIQNPVVQNCGYNQYWNGSYCVNNQPTTSLPTVSTLGTISVGATAVAVDGYYTANGCDVYTLFKYGMTQSLGNTTSEVNRSNGSGSMAQSLSGLSANTTYYYQAQARNCVGTTTGSIRSFTTSNDTTRDTVIIRTITNNTTTNGGGGNAFIKLMITNNREIVRGDKEMTYEVSWENVSGRDLQNLVLETNFPDQLDVLDTDHGSIKREAHSVIYKIGDLKKNESGSMDITAQVTSGLRNGDPVVAQAIMAFENPKTRAAENAIAYDADEFATVDGNSVFGASLFGLDFLPTSLAGWLLIFLILLIIIILAHSYFSRNRGAQVMINSGNVPNNIPVDQAGNDYVVYRPTPKQ